MIISNSQQIWPPIYLKGTHRNKNSTNIHTPHEMTIHKYKRFPHSVKYSFQIEFSFYIYVKWHWNFLSSAEMPKQFSFVIRNRLRELTSAEPWGRITTSLWERDSALHGIERHLFFTAVIILLEEMATGYMIAVETHTQKRNAALTV